MATWIWCRDDVTGACYDVEERAIRDGMTPVEGYPENKGLGARPRRTKLFRDKDGVLAFPARTVAPDPDAPETDADTTPDETDSAEPADNINEEQTS